MTIIKVNNLSLRYGKHRPLLQNMHLELKAGQIIELTGANGSGKTSLLRALWGGLPVSTGLVQRNCSSAQLLYLGATPALLPVLSVTENLRAFAVYQVSVIAVIEALAYFGIVALAERLVAGLSTGEQQLVALTRLLLQPSQLWLLDEPFAHLDCQQQQRLQQLLQRFSSNGGAVLFTSPVSIGLTGAQVAHVA
jgi:heme exporter protein A